MALSRKRARDADRAHAVDLLARAYAEGRINRALHDERVTRVLHSKTLAPLQRMTADLADPLDDADRDEGAEVATPDGDWRSRWTRRHTVGVCLAACVVAAVGIWAVSQDEEAAPQRAEAPVSEPVQLADWNEFVADLSDGGPGPVVMHAFVRSDGSYVYVPLEPDSGRYVTWSHTQEGWRENSDDVGSVEQPRLDLRRVDPAVVGRVLEVMEQQIPDGEVDVIEVGRFGPRQQDGCLIVSGGDPQNRTTGWFSCTGVDLTAQYRG